MYGSPLRTPREWTVWSVRRFLGDSVPVRWASDGDESASKPLGTGSWIPRKKGNPISSALSEKNTATNHYIQYWHYKLYLCYIKPAKISKLYEFHDCKAYHLLFSKSTTFNFILTSTGSMSTYRQMNQRETTRVHITSCWFMTCQTAGTFILTSSPSTSWSILSPRIVGV